MGYKVFGSVRLENQKRVGSVRRDRWQYFLSSLDIGDVTNPPRNGSKVYRCSIGQHAVTVDVEFGPNVIYVSADSQRGKIRQRVRDANSNSVM